MLEKQKPVLLFPQKLLLFIAINLTAISTMNLILGGGVFVLSAVFENIIAAYKAVFHAPQDWLFSWFNIVVPWWVKDIFIVLGSFFYLRVQFFSL